MSDSGSGLPPAGWYDDPENPGQHRYWDGGQWTEQRRPADGGGTPPPAPGAPSAPSAGGASWPSSTGGTGGGFGTTPGAYGGAGAAPVGTKPDPWLWQSIVATLLCCLPLGVVGIVFAAQSKSAWDSGNAVEAKEKADKAKMFTLIAAGAGLLVTVVFFGMGLMGVTGSGNF